MNLVCCIKQVPDTTDVKIDPETNTLIRSGVESITNPYDLVAVQAAVDLKERYGGTVTVISMGPPQAEQALREALSLGADRAVLLSDRAFRRRRYPCHELHPLEGNRQAPAGGSHRSRHMRETGHRRRHRPGGTGHCHPPRVHAIYLRHGDQAGRSDRRPRYGETKGRERIRGDHGRLPAVLTVELELTKVKRASLPRLIDSLRASITVWNAESIQAEPRAARLEGLAHVGEEDILSPCEERRAQIRCARGRRAGGGSDAWPPFLEDAPFAGQLLKR